VRIAAPGVTASSTRQQNFVLAEFIAQLVYFKVFHQGTVQKHSAGIKSVMSVRDAFRRYPKEAEIIGRLLAGYADLEIDLMHCAQVVRDDLDTVLKTMFRTRGETARIGVADAFGRHHYSKLKLETEFGMALSAIRFCLKIRNQYAHCIWYDDYTGKLAFTDLEEIAEENAFLTDLRSLTILHVDVPLLESQEAYYRYADHFLSWVNFEGRTRAGKLKLPLIAKPKQQKQPPLHCP
jgi:hypothetical protein